MCVCGRVVVVVVVWGGEWAFETNFIINIHVTQEGGRGGKKKKKKAVSAGRVNCELICLPTLSNKPS